MVTDNEPTIAVFDDETHIVDLSADRLAPKPAVRRAYGGEALQERVTSVLERGTYQATARNTSRSPRNRSALRGLTPAYELRDIDGFERLEREVGQVKRQDDAASEGLGSEFSDRLFEDPRSG